MKQLTNISLGAVALALLLLASACGKSEQKTEGPAEKAGATLGKAIDQATEKAGEAMTKAGEAMKEAGQKAKESVSEAVDKMKEDKK
jgi:outer membrane murein-binding lipoprotein Lpp